MENRYIGYFYPKDSKGNYVKVDTILNGILNVAHDYPDKAVKIKPKKETPGDDEPIVPDNRITATNNEDGTVNVDLQDDGVTVTANEDGTVNVGLEDLDISI